jgi:hypothetical protein
MISNFVAFAGSARNDLRMFCDIFPNNEEGGFNVVSREDVEQLRGERGTRPVVKSHRDVGSIDMDGIERDTRFRRGVLVICPGLLRCSLGLCSKSMRRDYSGKAKEQQTGNRHEREVAS